MQNLKYCELFKKFNKSYDLKGIKCACVFLKNEAIIVDNEDNVYHLVNSGSRQISKLCKKEIVDFAYCHSVVKIEFGYHILALTKSGKVYGWGRNNYKQVSSTEKEDVIVPERLKITKGPQPTRISKSPLEELNETYHCCVCMPSCNLKADPYESFKLIACGFAHCMAITVQNNIIVWGNNKLGQIGNDEKVIRGSPIVAVHKIMVMDEAIPPSCGFFDSLKAYALFITQYLPSLLPLKCLQQVKIPKRIEIRDRETEIVSIGCGSFHSLVLFKSGNLYGWGDNRYGQLGNTKQTILSPILIASNVEHIASTNLYTIILTKQGVVYAMGDNTYAQLGNNKQGFYQEPIEIPNLKFDKISTINQLTIGLTIDNKCYIWGLYKMVKVYNIKTDPNRVIEENNEQIIERAQNSFGSVIGTAATVVGAVALNEGLNEFMRAARNSDEQDSIEEKPQQVKEEDIVDEQTEEIEDQNEDQESNEDMDENNDNFKNFNNNFNALGIAGLTAVLSQVHNHDDTIEENAQDELVENDYGNSDQEADEEKLTYIITKPTMIECKSFEKIIAKILSLTNGTITFDQIEFNPDENDENEIIDLKILTEKKSGINSEMRKNIKILGQELKKVGNNKIKVFFGDHNKFSVISDSYVLPKRDLNITDVNQAAKSMFGMSLPKMQI